MPRPVPTTTCRPSGAKVTWGNISAGRSKLVPGFFEATSQRISRLISFPFFWSVPTLAISRPSDENAQRTGSTLLTSSRVGAAGGDFVTSHRRTQSSPQLAASSLLSGENAREPRPLL